MNKPEQSGSVEGLAIRSSPSKPCTPIGDARQQREGASVVRIAFQDSAGLSLGPRDVPDSLEDHGENEPCQVAIRFAIGPRSEPLTRALKILCLRPNRGEYASFGVWLSYHYLQVVQMQTQLGILMRKLCLTATVSIILAAGAPIAT